MAADRALLQRFSALIKKTTGIELEEAKLERAVRRIEEVADRHGIEDLGTLYHRIRFGGDRALLQELINAVTINETYFWREHEAFEICCRKILPTVAKERNDRIRILVAPCSSGEEVYSLMIAIAEEGSVLTSHAIEIIGIDIDSNMIEKAKRGLYTARSVDPLPSELKRRYFTRMGRHYLIDERFRSAATFLTANIFDTALPLRLGRFDILFSRNMLIYFAMEEKRKCYDQFDKLLKPGGYLFLGHADANGIDKKRFIPLDYPAPVFKRVANPRRLADTFRSKNQQEG